MTDETPKKTALPEPAGTTRGQLLTLPGLLAISLYLIVLSGVLIFGVAVYFYVGHGPDSVPVAPVFFQGRVEIRGRKDGNRLVDFQFGTLRAQVARGHNRTRFFDGQRLIRVEVKTVDRTGVEMEALTGACAAALTVYDMLKSEDRGMVIEKVQLEHKSGGRSGTWQRRR